MKLGLGARDHFRRQELAIGIQDEQIARPVEDDASARPSLILVGPSQSAPRGITSLVAASLCPCVVMARAVSETIAIRLGLVQQAAGGEEPRFAVCGLRHPENSEVRRLARSWS